VNIQIVPSEGGEQAEDVPYVSQFFCSIQLVLSSFFLLRTRPEGGGRGVFEKER